MANQQNSSSVTRTVFWHSWTAKAPEIRLAERWQFLFQRMLEDAVGYLLSYTMAWLCYKQAKMTSWEISISGVVQVKKNVKPTITKLPIVLCVFCLILFCRKKETAFTFSEPSARIHWFPLLVFPLSLWTLVCPKALSLGLFSVHIPCLGDIIQCHGLNTVYTLADMQVCMSHMDLLLNSGLWPLALLLTLPCGYHSDILYF